MWSCIDGRSTDGILGTPGGDSGEFVRALTIFQQNGGNITSEQDVVTLFRGFMATISEDRPFYMHTDYTSVQNLQNLIKAIYPQYVCLLRLPKKIQQQVFPMLVDPSNIGCSHLKTMMLRPDEYQTPANLTGAFIKAYFDYMWNHEDFSKLNWFMEDYEVLLGNHTESAVINILPILPPTGKCSGKLPMIAPTSNSYSFYINHPNSVGPFRDQLASFFAPLLSNMTAAQFRSALDVLGSFQTNLTVTYTAGDKSIFYVTINVTESPGPVTNTTNATSTGTPSYNATSGSSSDYQTTGSIGTTDASTTGTTALPVTTGTTGTTGSPATTGTAATPATTGTTGSRATTGTTGSTTAASGASIVTTGVASQSSGGSSAGPAMIILALLIVVVGGTLIVYFVNRYGFTNLVNKVKTTFGFHTASTVSSRPQPQRTPQPSFLEMRASTEQTQPHTPVALDEV